MLALPYRQMTLTIAVMNIGRVIYAVRKEKSLKLEEVALDAGTDAGYLSRIEAGRRTPSLPMLERIAGAMGVQVSQLMFMAESNSEGNLSGNRIATSDVDLSDEAVHLRQHYSGLNHANRLLTLEIVKTLKNFRNNNSLYKKLVFVVRFSYLQHFKSGHQILIID